MQACFLQQLQISLRFQLVQVPANNFTIGKKKLLGEAGEAGRFRSQAISTSRTAGFVERS